MSDEQIIIGFAVTMLALALPIFAYQMRKTNEAASKLDVAMLTLAAFLAIFGGLLVKNERS